MRHLLSAITVIAVVAPSIAAPVPKEARDGPVYFPTAVGTKWVYKLATSTTESTEVVTGNEPKDGAVIVSIGRELSGRVLPTSKVAVSKAGVVRVSSGARDLDSPQTLLKQPVRPGDSWEWDLGNGRNTKLTVRGVEEIEVPAGKYNAVRVDAEYTQVNGREYRITSWYAPRVGLVKSLTKIGDNETVRVLKSFTAGKE